MTYKRPKTLGEVTQELDEISERFGGVADKQLNLIERLEYLEDAVEELLAAVKPKKDKK